MAVAVHMYLNLSILMFKVFFHVNSFPALLHNEFSGTFIYTGSFQ